MNHTRFTHMTDEEKFAFLRDLWEQRRTKPFPKECLGKSINGNDFVLLDSYTAGCISTFLSTGTLDLWRACTLGICYHDMAEFIPVLNHEAAKYFGYLEIMAGLTLSLVMAQAYREQKEQEEGRAPSQEE
jgi:hypothetical protein